MSWAEDKGREREPNISLHPRFVVVEDDPTLKLNVVPKEEKVISRKVYDKESTLFQRQVGGKPCWFKIDDKVSELGDICFANGVSPESKEYELQDLLHQMDEKLIHDYHQKHNADIEVDDGIHNKIQKLERKQKLNRTVFAIDTQNDDDTPNQRRGRNRKGEKESESSDRRTGRTVLYLTVGQMKHTRIVLKSRTQSEVELK